MESESIVSHIHAVLGGHEDALPLARQIAKAYPGDSLSQAKQSELAAIVGRKRAARLLGAVGIAYEFSTRPLYPTCANLSTLLRYLRGALPCMSTLPQEHFWALSMNSRLKPICMTLAHVGTAASVDVHPRDVLRSAVRASAHSVVVVHNHPSGDPTPTRSDTELTKRLVSAGDLMGIPVVDHIVLTSEEHFSFRSEMPHVFES